MIIISKISLILKFHFLQSILEAVINKKNIMLIGEKIGYIFEIWSTQKLFLTENRDIQKEFFIKRKLNTKEISE